MRRFLVCLGALVVSLGPVAAQDSGFKSSKDFKASKDFKPGNDFKPPKDFKSSKDFKPGNDFKPPKDFKSSKDFKPANDFKPPQDFKPSNDFKPRNDFKPGQGSGAGQQQAVRNFRAQPGTLALGGSRSAPPAPGPASPSSDQPVVSKPGRITITGADSVTQ